MDRHALIAGGFCLLVSLLSPVNLCRAQDTSVVGHWEGAYVREGSIQPLMLDLEVRDGKLGGTFDIPELEIVGEPIKDIDAGLPKLMLGLTYGLFTMHVSPELGEMTGENTNWNPPLTLHLKRVESYGDAHFPREDFRFENGVVTLVGSLVKPTSNPPFPAIVVVHGSGNQGRGTSYYARWGDFFARHGVAALIYDKRGVGQSSGNHERATFDDLAGDVLAAVEGLKERSDIKASQIGLFGISQGGWLAPLAASRTDNVAYLILNVGPSVSVQEQELHRVEYSLRADEYSEEDIEKALAYTELVFTAAYGDGDRQELFAKAEDVKSQKWADYVNVVGSDADLDGWRLIRYDPSPVLKRTTIPLLALFGEHDVLVPPQENVDRLRGYLTEAGNSDFTIRVIPGVGHNMETFGTLKGGEWKWPEKYWIWPRKSPVIYETIFTWLTEHGIAQ
jgi:pimeloyl-ACP methyl ester carboxylesterase